MRAEPTEQVHTSGEQSVARKKNPKETRSDQEKCDRIQFELKERCTSLLITPPVFYLDKRASTDFSLSEIQEPHAISHNSSYSKGVVLLHYSPVLPTTAVPFTA